MKNYISNRKIALVVLSLFAFTLTFVRQHKI